MIKSVKHLGEFQFSESGIMDIRFNVYRLKLENGHVLHLGNIISDERYGENIYVVTKPKHGTVNIHKTHDDFCQRVFWPVVHFMGWPEFQQYVSGIFGRD